MVSPPLEHPAAAARAPAARPPLGARRRGGRLLARRGPRVLDFRLGSTTSATRRRLSAAHADRVLPDPAAARAARPAGGARRAWFVRIACSTTSRASSCAPPGGSASAPRPSATPAARGASPARSSSAPASRRRSGRSTSTRAPTVLVECRPARGRADRPSGSASARGARAAPPAPRLGPRRGALALAARRGPGRPSS